MAVSAYKKTHIPKFGNWEGDSVPYTVYFENARKGKAIGRRMNPEEYPEIFKALADVKGDTSRMDHPKQQRNSRRGSTGSYSSISSSVSSELPESQTEQNQPSKNPTHPKHHRAASIPKFGAWDATDPTSGEGFTVLFNKVKQEKHIRTINLSTLTQPPSKPKNSKKKLKWRSRLASKVPNFLLINCCCYH